MKCVGLVSTGRTAEALTEADLVVESLTSLSAQTFHELVDKRT